MPRRRIGGLPGRGAHRRCAACLGAGGAARNAGPRQQGRGIGGRLVRAAIDAAAAAGLPAITLTTFRDLPWNQPFYARLGFATLQADGLNVRLQAILAREASLGLPAARRCAMRREIAAARR
ncbi:acetyltransferase, GNAT family [Bordetella pertussis STO1-CHOC-0017]|nr:acetyltransferase, GNAT family [Bordetella pertussis STO1-CHOC-0017]